MAASLKGKSTSKPQSRGILCKSCHEPIVGMKVTEHWSKFHPGAFKQFQHPLGGGDAVRV